MFEPSSRYYKLEDATLTTKEGGKVTYKKRRFLPDRSKMIVIHELRVNDGDRLDNISARVAGSGELFWQICDANNIMHPLEITREPGGSFRIARPWS